MWVVLVGLMMLGSIDATVLLVAFGLGVFAELPQVGRALAGRSPFRIIPFEVLPM